MKKQIVMSAQEYKDQRETLETEIKERLEYKYKVVPVWTPTFIIILFGWLLPNLLGAYNDFPKLTMFTFSIAGLMYCFLIYQYIIMIKQYIKGNN